MTKTEADGIAATKALPEKLKKNNKFQTYVVICCNKNKLQGCLENIKEFIDFFVGKEEPIIKNGNKLYKNEKYPNAYFYVTILK